jgi:hypothetical protein
MRAQATKDLSSEQNPHSDFPTPPQKKPKRKERKKEGKKEKKEKKIETGNWKLKLGKLEIGKWKTETERGENERKETSKHTLSPCQTL